MENRFRLAGHDLGVDARRSHATLGPGGVLDAAIVAGAVPDEVAQWASVPPRILVSGIPIRFDGDRFGATVDQDLVDDLLLDDGGVTFVLSSRFEVFGTMTVAAGDRLRFRGEVATPWADSPWSLDVVLAFGGRRRVEV